MVLIYRSGAVEIWRAQEHYGFEFYVYGLLNDPIVCPSESMARAVAAGAS
tara:strand:- start:900 stop:1049 length:150 start_codon:yes stop_codon:yes gene_type:complete